MDKEGPGLLVGTVVCTPGLPVGGGTEQRRPKTVKAGGRRSYALEAGEFG